MGALDIPSNISFTTLLAIHMYKIHKDWLVFEFNGAGHVDPVSLPNNTSWTGCPQTGYILLSVSIISQKMLLDISFKLIPTHQSVPQSAFYVNIYRAVIGPSGS